MKKTKTMREFQDFELTKLSHDRSYLSPSFPTTHFPRCRSPRPFRHHPLNHPSRSTLTRCPTANACLNLEFSCY